ncbi:MAG: hypothetical protein GX053_08270 [Tissierella sp.]|nr:hypothetical protein [Tissierella sp.]
MLSNEKIPKSKYYLILIFTSIIILSISLESIFRAKDLSLFENWLDINNMTPVDDYDFNQGFNSYIVIILSNMFLKIMIPASLSIYSYFAYIRIRINRLFIFIWTVLLLGGLAYEVVGLNIGSIFFYINIIAYIGLILTIVSLDSLIDRSK